MYCHFNRFRLVTASLFFFLCLTPIDGKSSHLLAGPIALSQNSTTQIDRLFDQAVTQYRAGDFRSALQTYQQVLIIRNNQKDRVGIAATLDNIGEVYTSLGNYDKALENLQEALTIRKEISDRSGIGETLNNIGFVYRQQGDYAKALELHQQALAIAEQVGNLAVKGEALHNIAAVYEAQSDYDKALELYQQALTIRQQVGDKRDEGRTLNNIGNIYFNSSEYDRALEYYQQALAIRRTINDKAGVARLLSNIGLLYNNQNQYQQSIEYYEQALPILREIGDKPNLGKALNFLGVTYENLSQYDKALQFYQQSLEIAKEIGDRSTIGKTLDNIGGIAYSLGRYPQALESYQESLKITQEIGEKKWIATALNNLAGVYSDLGQYSQALEYLQQANVIFQEIKDPAKQARALDAIGTIYDKLKQYPKALEYYQQALAISQQIKDQQAAGNALEHIGGVYTDLQQYSQAEVFLQKALSIRQQLGDKAGEGRNLNSIASFYFSQGNYTKSLDFLQQSLAILQQIGDRSNERIALSNIGNILERKKQPLLAIIFYKESVNVTESIRKEIKVLSREQQQSFTDTISDTYRHLANLLLKQNRATEAQQVLDLLKVQELDEYLKNVRGNEKTAQGVDLLPPEQQIYQKYSQALQVNKELAQLRSIPIDQRTPAQQQRIAELEKNRLSQNTEITDFVNNPDVIALLQQLQTAKGRRLNLANINRLQETLRNLSTPAVILYPIILEDRLELVLVRPNSAPINQVVPVKREELNSAIVQFRKALRDPYSEPTEPARKLYNILIKPVEKEIKQSKAKTIIYAPDAKLRYIPIAALFDGKKWLVQRFAINYITAARLTDIKPIPRHNPHVLAAAFTKGNFNFTVANHQVSFDGLQFAGLEVNELAATLQNTTILLDRAFSKQAVIPRLNEYNIIHFATHAAFVAGEPEDSFILFGDGSRVTLRDVETWSLPNADLVVLSACETGVGEQLSNGKEILGFGYQMQQIGAKATIASLWSISDGGTQALMNNFYAALTSPGETLGSRDINKAEALREAQIALITGEYKRLGERRGIGVQARDENNLSPTVTDRLNHPYYWAPFILIGNGF